MELSWVRPLEKDSVIPLDSAWKKGRFGEDGIIGGIDSGYSGYDDRIFHSLSTAAGNFVSDVSGRLVIKFAGRAKTEELRAVMKT